MYNLLTYQKGDSRGCFNSKYLRVCLPLYKKVVRHIFGILLKFKHVRQAWYGFGKSHCSAGVFSTARYGLYFEQYIDGYILKLNMYSKCMIHYYTCVFFWKNELHGCQVNIINTMYASLNFKWNYFTYANFFFFFGSSSSCGSSKSGSGEGGLSCYNERKQFNFSLVGFTLTEYHILSYFPHI